MIIKTVSKAILSVDMTDVFQNIPIKPVNTLEIALKYLFNQQVAEYMLKLELALPPSDYTSNFTTVQPNNLLRITHNGYV